MSGEVFGDGGTGGGGAVGGGFRVWAVGGLPEVQPGDDLAKLIAAAAGPGLLDGDVLLVTSKIVSKAEGASYRRRTGRPPSTPRPYGSSPGAGRCGSWRTGRGW